jgi:hypothetical protein
MIKTVKLINIIVLEKVAKYGSLELCSCNANLISRIV